MLGAMKVTAPARYCLQFHRDDEHHAESGVMLEWDHRAVTVKPARQFDASGDQTGR
jgi:hypothetical protein